MDFLFNNWQFIVVLIGYIGGYYDLRNLAKSNKEFIIEHKAKIEELDTQLRANDKYDGVIQSQVKELMSYKEISSQSKDYAMQKLSSIESYVKSIDKRLDKIEQKVNS